MFLWANRFTLIRGWIFKNTTELNLDLSSQLFYACRSVVEIPSSAKQKRGYWKYESILYFIYRFSGIKFQTSKPKCQMNAKVQNSKGLRVIEGFDI
jgi:hypothetical protein